MKDLLKKEFIEKYGWSSAEEEYLKFMLIDTVVIIGLLLIVYFSVLAWSSTLFVAAIGVIVIGSIIGLCYAFKKHKLKNEIIDNNSFLDFGFYFKDGSIEQQITFEKCEMLNENRWILINDMFIMETSAMFHEDYDIKSILSFTKGKVLTKYGVGDGMTVVLFATYEDETVINGKDIPIFMLRNTEPVLMELAG